MIDELVRRYLLDFPDKTICIISVDPSKRKTGGALLGDRIRMNSIHNDRVYMRSLATRQANLSLSKHIAEAVAIGRAAHFDMLILETSGIGQSDTEITTIADVSLYVMTQEYGAATQLEKIDMLDFADLIAINKFDKPGSLDALRDVQKQYRRNHNVWDVPAEELPVYATVASQFNDSGTNLLYVELLEKLAKVSNHDYLIPPADSPFRAEAKSSEIRYIIPPDRSRYLAEIADLNRLYQEYVEKQAATASQLYQIDGTLKTLKTKSSQNAEAVFGRCHRSTGRTIHPNRRELAGECRSVVKNWPHLVKKYKAETYDYQVRGKTISQPLYVETLSGTQGASGIAAHF